MKSINTRFIRYLFAGGFNTGITYLIYLALLYFFNYYTAYTITYVIGIVISYLVNSYFVFHQALSWKKIAQFPAVYLVQYILGLACLHIFVGQMGIDERVAPILIIFITIPITYLLSGYILKERT